MPPLLLVLLAHAEASPVEFYGFGAESMGRGQGGVAITDDLGATFLCPAGLGRLERARLLAGFAVMRQDLEDLPDVWWDTNRDGLLDEADAPLELSPPEEPSDAVLLASGVPIGRLFALGVGVLVPTQRLLRLKTFEPSLPTYFMYDNRLARYDLAAGGAVNLPGGLRLGAGGRMLPRGRLDFTMTMRFEADGDGTGGGTQVTVEDIVGADLDPHELVVELVMGVVPQVGFQWDVGEVVEPLDGLSVGGTWSGSGGLPIDVTVDLQVEGAAVDVGELEPLVFAILAELGLSIYDHYVPARYAGGVGYTFRDTLTVYGDATRNRWSRMELNVARVVAASIDMPLLDLSDIEITDGNPTGAVFEDTWSLRMGTELALPVWQVPHADWLQLRVRGGVGYEPTPLVAQTAATALLDADRLMLSLGLGVKHGVLFDLVEGPVRWDLFLQNHRLARGALSRPEPGGPREGYPVDGGGIPIGGSLVAFGLQWSVEY